MRAVLASLAVLVLASAGGRASQGATTQAPGPAQPPTFRAGTDVLTIDVVALDGSGRPVADLQASDFTVRINGQVRRVVSADFVRMDGESASPGAASPAATPTPSSTFSARGRRIVIAVDQQNIRPGAITPLLAAASRFVDRLTPRDQMAFITLPDLGPNVDFTTDKARLRAAMQGLVGQPSQIGTLEYSMGLSEAFILHEREGPQIPSVERPDRPDPPVMAAMMERNCTATDAQGRDICRRAYLQQADRMVQMARREATISTRAIESLITALASVEGPKSLVLISTGLLINDQSEIEALIRTAEGSRTSVYVLAVPPDLEDAPLDRKVSTQGPTTSEDRRLRTEGLTAISTPGGLYNVVGTGDAVFDRLGSELAAYYLLGVESRPGDESRPRQKVSVEARRGVRTRASLAFSSAPAPPPVVPRLRSIEDVLRDALASPSALSELSLSVATLVQRDVKGGKVRVTMAAQVVQPDTPPEVFAVGFLVTDKDESVVAGSKNASTLMPSGNAARGVPLEFGTSVLLDPGTYSLRFGVVDSEGRRGTVVRDLTIRSMTGEGLTTSDLIAGNPPAGGQSLSAAIEPRVSAGQLAAYLELYSTALEDLEWMTVDFEIAKSEDAPALTRESGDVGNGPEPSWRVARGLLDLDMLEAGRYVVRANVILDSKTLVTLVRPFVLERK